MVRTRRSKEIEEEPVHDDSGNAQASGSDSDDAPEEVSLAHSKTVRYYVCYVFIHNAV